MVLDETCVTGSCRLFAFGRSRTWQRSLEVLLNDG
jgi:hypothetical protein